MSKQMITDKTQTIERLNEIAVELRELADEALMLLKDAGVDTRAFESYGYAEIVMAIDDSHGYCGSCQRTLGDMIEALEC